MSFQKGACKISNLLTRNSLIRSAYNHQTESLIAYILLARGSNLIKEMKDLSSPENLEDHSHNKVPFLGKSWLLVMLPSARQRPGDSLPLFDLHQRIELQQYSSRTSKPNRSASLADLLKWVDEARDETRNRNTAQAYWPHPTSPSLSTTAPFVLSFHNLTYSVKNRRKMAVSSLFHWKKSQELGTKVLLNDISGEAKEGEIMAVLGASGSGKSTLIDALANCIAKESLGGTITLNGEVLESRLSKVISAYVMQDDLLYPMLTVEETLMFSAEFRLPRSLSKRRKRARVQALIDQLGLRNAANTVIGDEGHRGVSGGERRRVSIGIDIIHDPIILFLDEPTSGLDSTSAFMVVKVLQRIAQSGSIVIMSIHQPSYRILSLLDRMIFLSRGNTVYNGSPASLPRFFSEFGHPIPEYENKTEFALDLIQELEESPGGTKNLVEFNKSWQRSRNLIQNTNRTDRRSRTPKVSLRDAISTSMAKGKLVSGSTTSDPSLTSLVPKFANPFWMEMFVISRRSLTNSRRAPELFGTRLGAVLVTAVIFATIFHNLSDTPRGVQERVGFLALAMSTTFYICAEAMPMFIQDRYIFMRETAYNAYRRSSYVLAHLIISLPSLVILSLAFVSVTFWTVGHEGGLEGFLFFFYAVMAAFWVGSSYVTFLSGIVSHIVLGFTIVIAIIAYFVLFSGFFITRDRIPPYWIWFHYISLVKYPYDSIVQSEFGGADKCFVRGLQMFDSTPLGAFPTSVKLKLLKNMGNALKMNITASTCVTTGADILKMQGISDLSKWSALWITVAWGFFFRILFYFTLRLGSKNKRR